ncbi:hypothetical protein GCM10017690_32670 [Microbacterium terregens]
MRPSFYDRWTSRTAADPRLARRWAWLAPLLVTVLAGILRLWDLGRPHALVFDETYYVKDAWAQWILGYAAKWPDGANAAFLAGDTEGFTSAGSFVVHPPLGKFLIGVGMAIFGPDSSFGWRITTALFGTATVLVLYLVAKALTGSVAFATVASFLMAIDGLAIVLSRIALLDIFLTVLRAAGVLVRAARSAGARGAAGRAGRDPVGGRRASGLGTGALESSVGDGRRRRGRCRDGREVVRRVRGGRTRHLPRGH